MAVFFYVVGVFVFHHFCNCNGLFMPDLNNSNPYCALSLSLQYVTGQIALSDRVMNMTSSGLQHEVLATCPPNFKPVLQCSNGISTAQPFCPSGYMRNGMECVGSNLPTVIAKCPQGFKEQDICTFTAVNTFHFLLCKKGFRYDINLLSCAKETPQGTVELDGDLLCPPGFDRGWFFVIYCRPRTSTGPNCPLGMKRRGWKCIKDEYSELAKCDDGYDRGELCEVEGGDDTYDNTGSTELKPPCRPGYRQVWGTTTCQLHSKNARVTCPNGFHVQGNGQCRSATGKIVMAGCPFGYHEKADCVIKGVDKYRPKCDLGFHLNQTKFNNMLYDKSVAYDVCERFDDGGNKQSGKPLQCKPGYMEMNFNGMMCLRRPERAHPKCPETFTRVGWTCYANLIDMQCPPLSSYDLKKKTCVTSTQPFVCNTRARSSSTNLYLPAQPLTSKWMTTPCVNFISSGCRTSSLWVEMENLKCFPGFHPREITLSTTKVPTTIPYNERNHWWCTLDKKYAKCPTGWVEYLFNYCLRMNIPSS